MERRWVWRVVPGTAYHYSWVFQCTVAPATCWWTCRPVCLWPQSCCHRNAVFVDQNVGLIDSALFSKEPFWMFIGVGICNEHSRLTISWLLWGGTRPQESHRVGQLWRLDLLPCLGRVTNQFAALFDKNSIKTQYFVFCHALLSNMGLPSMYLHVEFPPSQTVECPPTLDS